MNNQKLIGLLVIAFALGDAEGIIRANRRSKKLLNHLKSKNELQQVKTTALIAVINDITAGESLEDALTKYMQEQEFIDIAETLI